MKDKKIVLHICCAICGVYLVEHLVGVQNFEPLLYFYNPNIHSKINPSLAEGEGGGIDDEYQKRLESVKKLAEIYKLELIEGEYEPKKWFEKVQGLEDEPEGGKRCSVCFKMRLEKTAQIAKEKNISYFTTTLSASSFKDEKLIAQIGKEIADKYNLQFIDSFGDQEFKKQALQKARLLAKEYNFYHQKYCGCVFSQM